MRRLGALVVVCHIVGRVSVSVAAGYANIQITLDTCSHLLPGMQEAAVDAFDKALADPLAVPIG